LPLNVVVVVDDVGGVVSVCVVAALEGILLLLLDLSRVILCLSVGMVNTHGLEAGWRSCRVNHTTTKTIHYLTNSVRKRGEDCTMYKDPT
jgi:hypothetical protein